MLSNLYKSDIMHQDSQNFVTVGKHTLTSTVLNFMSIYSSITYKSKQFLYNGEELVQYASMYHSYCRQVCMCRTTANSVSTMDYASCKPEFSSDNGIACM